MNETNQYNILSQGYEILSYGTIGLGFLLALLAYRLLSQEQNKTEPNKSILKSINTYMFFSVTLCLIGCSLEIFRHINGKNIQQDENIVKVTFLTANPDQTIIGGTETSINEIEKIIQEKISKKIKEKCFINLPNQRVYGTIESVIIKGEKGYQRTMAFSKTNIESPYKECIRDVFSTTKFPEPSGNDIIRRNIKTNEEISISPSYWIKTKIEVKSF